MILAARLGVRVNTSPPMFSSMYFSQYSSELWYALQNGLAEASWIDSRILNQQGLIVFLQVFFSLFVIVAVYRNRQVLKDSERWQFLCSSAFFCRIIFWHNMCSWCFMNIGGFKTCGGFTFRLLAAFPLPGLIGALYPASWKSQFVYGINYRLYRHQTSAVIMLPLPLIRLFTVLAALAGLLFCLRWAGETRRQKDSDVYRWALRAGACFLAFVIIAEIWGKQGLAEFLFISLLRSVAPVLAFMLFMYIIRGFIEWIFRSSSLQRMALFYWRY